MGVYAFFYSKSFYTLDKNLTFYESLGQSKQYKFLNSNWIKRRLNSFKFLESILKNKTNLYKNFDFFITKFLANFF